MKIYILEAEHESVPGRIIRAFAASDLRAFALGQLDTEFGKTLENVELFELELEENFRP